jgi:hypothetical protein
VMRSTQPITKCSGRTVTSLLWRPASPSAMTVRVRNGKLSINDGPFVETKEQLGGFYLIDAKDLNEAVQVAPKIASARMTVSRCSRPWSSSSHRAGDQRG